MGLHRVRRPSPISEKMLCMLEQSEGLLSGRDRELMRQRFLGTTLETIAGSMGTYKQRISRIENSAFGRLSVLSEPLVSEWRSFSRSRLSPEEIRATRMEYLQRPEVRAKACRKKNKKKAKKRSERELKAMRKEYYSGYYERNKEKIKARARKRHRDKLEERL